MTSALFSFWPKQIYAFDEIFERGVEQLLYGGAAGGAKSHFVRGLGVYLAHLWPGSSFGVFRRTDNELMENHIEPWLETVAPFVAGGVWQEQKKQYWWPSPDWCWCLAHEPCPHSSYTKFRHVDDNRGAKKHQGTEFAATGVDEATHFTGPDLDFLYTRVRASVSDREPHTVQGPDGRSYQYPGWPGWRKLGLYTANPGDVGEQYMIDNYIEPEAGLELLGAHDRKIVDGPIPLTNADGQSIWTARVRLLDGGSKDLRVDVSAGRRWTVEIDLGPGKSKVRVKRAFIPAKLEDNPALDAEDYAANLSIGSMEQRRRLLDGDWSYSEDRVFPALDDEIHKIDARWVFGTDRYGAANPCPAAWPRGIGQDHGTTKPTAAIWVAYEDEGFLIAYMEYYAPGDVTSHVQAIKNLMIEDGHPNLSVECDPRMFHRVIGHNRLYSSADVYRHLGEPPVDAGERRRARDRGVTLRQSKITDHAALIAMHDLIEPQPDRSFPYWHSRAGDPGAPLLFICQSQCPNLWRELKSLKHPSRDADGYHPEEIKTGQPDHAFDAIKRIAPVLRLRVEAPKRRRLGALQLKRTPVSA